MKPLAPPCRHMYNYKWMNEWELVEWYTKIGKNYGQPQTEFNILDKVFMPDYKNKLIAALEENTKIK